MCPAVPCVRNETAAYGVASAESRRRRPPPRYRSRRAHPRLGQTMAAACSNWDHFLDDWHVCDIARPRMDFRFRRRAVMQRTSLQGPNLTQCMVRPCSQEDFFELADVRSCINVSGLRLEHVALRAIMDINARATSLPDRPRTGHLGHQFRTRPGRPILHLVLSSRRPRQVKEF